MASAVERRVLLRRIALTLWIVWAIAVWNVVFDYVIVAAGREYLAAAARAAGAYPRMDDWMAPAITRGLWMATAAAGTILFVGFAAIRAASINSNPAVRHRGRPRTAERIS